MLTTLCARSGLFTKIKAEEQASPVAANRPDPRCTRNLKCEISNFKLSYLRFVICNL